MCVLDLKSEKYLNVTFALVFIIISIPNTEKKATGSVLVLTYQYAELEVIFNVTVVLSNPENQKWKEANDYKFTGQRKNVKES